MKRKLAIILIAGGIGTAGLIGCDSMYSSGSGNINPGDFLNNGRTATSTFSAIQVDPPAEDSAGPQFADVGDFNNDGMLDIASAWNQSQPIQIHVQQRTATGGIVFATIPVGGTSPIARVAGLKVADLDQDGFDDIVVLVKDTGLIARCDPSRDDCDVTENGGLLENAVSGAMVLFFNPGNVYEEPFVSTTIPQAQLAGTDEEDPLPEKGGYTSLDVGEIDGVDGPDIVVALNRAEGDPATDDFINSIDLYPNPGGATGRNGDNWDRIPIHGDVPKVGACRIVDVDDDGDNDIVATFPNAKNANVRWIPNPANFGDVSDVYGVWPQHAPIGQVATEADIVDIADIDGDGHSDVLVRSATGKIIQWFKRPAVPSSNFIRNPWQVYSIAEFSERPPAAIALGDVTGDGKTDAAIAAGGAVAWFTPYSGNDTNVYNFWQESLLIDDDPASVTDPNADPLAVVATDPNSSGLATGGTLINSLIIVDVDGDGYNDIIATLDRGALSGLSNDALVLFRNNRGN
ncbi:MAG: VCBS repeat-containing protein [Phycisphaerales bacterium]|nr:VCBS repeat-containing protein [Phycisphaerales bacterium]